MPAARDGEVLEAVLDSWDRNNTILVNLLRALPEGGLAARAAGGSHSVGELINHVHFVRLVFVLEDSPESARPLPAEQWGTERDQARLARMLDDSARAVSEAVAGRIAAGRDMDQHYDHPILMLQHLIWHEGYHHGQIKLALSAAGLPLSDEVAGPLTWDVWMDKTGASSRPPRAVPPGFHTVTPRIVVEDVPALARFLATVFGATGALRIDAPTQLAIGDSLVLLSEAGPRPVAPAFLYVYVDDADATYRRALDAGAASLESVRDTPYGDRRGMVQDPFGNVWQIATHRPPPAKEST